MKCADVSTLLVDFLYEEMPAEQRREFLAHVDGCASCSAEVKAMASTLGHARAALRGPLSEEPPAGVRARMLQAAEAASVAKEPDSAKPRRAPQPQGFFARLWKTPWLIPALGAAGVATVVLLVRVIKNPQVFPEQRPAATEILEQPAAAPEGLQQAQQPAEAEPKPAFPSPAAPVLAKKPIAESDSDFYAERKHAASKPHAAEHAPSKLGTAGRRLTELSDEALGGAGEALARAPAGAATTAKGGFRAAAPSKAPTAAIATRQPATRVEKDESILDHAPKPLAEGRSGAIGAGAGSSARWAEPPPPRPAAAPIAAAPSPRVAEAAPAAFAAAPAPAETAPAKKTKRAPALEDQLESAPQESVRAPERAKAQAPMPPASPAARAEAPADKKKVSENKDSISLEERVRKAEKLFAEKKWAEAAAAFRTLIAQAPSHSAVKTWRERLATAEGAEEQGRAAKAKKASTNDALDGL